MQIQIDGITTLTEGIDNCSKRVMHSAIVGVTKALDRALELSRAELNETDHSLKDLAALGHPYSKANPQVIHDPDTIVHAQTGDYIDALRVSKPTSDAYGVVGGDVHVAEEQAQLDRWIQQGTTKMRARPWMQDVVDNHGTELSNIVQAEIEVAVARDAFRK